MPAHFKAQQVTIFTAVVWYRLKQGDNLIVRSYAVVSDYMEHNKSAVHMFNKLIIDDVKQHTVTHAHYWSDGATSQFISKYNLNNLLHHKLDNNTTADWSFFGWNHGKGPVDGVGGQ